MEQQRIALSPETVDKMAHIDGSVAHWSQEYTRLMLQAKSMLENIDSLYQARHSMLDGLIKDAGIDHTRVMNVQAINGDGKSELLLFVKPAPPSVAVASDVSVPVP